jgi:hypothetical protein
LEEALSHGHRKLTVPPSSDPNRDYVVAELSDWIEAEGPDAVVRAVRREAMEMALRPEPAEIVSLVYLAQARERMSDADAPGASMPTGGWNLPETCWARIVDRMTPTQAKQWNEAARSVDARKRAGEDVESDWKRLREQWETRLGLAKGKAA